jgi:pimeloyl-ACP methyl ester carboxylesterase
MNAFLRLLAASLCVAIFASGSRADDGPKILSVDHYVRTKSTAPAAVKQDVLLYVREVVAAGTALRTKTGNGRVVLFVHGSGTPSEVGFDVPYEDYSWMAYLAKAGFDTFAVDLTGYGRSTRPLAMNDACNFRKDQQGRFVPGRIAAPCEPSFQGPMSTMGSDFDDIDAVVEYLRNMRGVDSVAMVGWSQGGPRTGGYAAKYPAKVSRLVVLAPAYARDIPETAPDPLPTAGGPMNAQSRDDFIALWNRQAPCKDQYDPAIREIIWSEMLASDPVGATWGPGVRRAPTVPTYGFGPATVAKLQTPYLMIAGQHDGQVAPERVRQLYEDLGSKQKVFIDLACSSHNAMWERNHRLLFQATVEWLRDGKVGGVTEGVLKLGY